MSRPSAPRGGRRPKHQKSKADSPLHPNRSSATPPASNSTFGDDSILLKIKDLLTSDNHAIRDNERHETSSGSSEIQPGGRCKSTLSNSTSSSSDTLITDLSDNTDVLNPSIQSSTRIDVPSDNDICKIIDLRRGTCLHGDKCGRPHVFADFETRKKTQVGRLCTIPINKEDSKIAEGAGKVVQTVDNVRKCHYPHTMSSTPLDEPEAQHNDHSDTIVKLPPASQRDSRPGLCRNYQRGHCFRQACKYLHTSNSLQSLPSRESSVTNGGLTRTGLPVSTEPAISNRRIPGHCWKWQRGACIIGNRCRYRHVDPSKEESNVNSNVSLKASDAQLSRPSQTTSPAGNVFTEETTTTLPVKDGCTFCLLGLCSGTHKTAMSFMVANSKTSQMDKPILRTSDSTLDNETRKGESSGTSSISPVTKPFVDKQPAAREELTVTLLKSTRVTFGRGLHVVSVSTAFESNIVTLGNLPATISEPDLRNIGEPFGEVLSAECKQANSGGWGSSGRLVYADSAQAASAVAALSGSDLFFTKITAQLYYPNRAADTGRLSACLVRVDIPAPGIVAYAGYETLEQAEKVVWSMHGSTYRNHVVAAHMHNGLPKAGPYTVRFEGLPHQTTDQHVRGFADSKGKPITIDVLLQKGSYKVLADATHVLRKILEEHGNVISFDFARPLPCNGRVSGIARFANSAGAAAARNALNGRRFAFLGHEKIYLQHLHRMTYKIPSAIHSVLLVELRRLAGFARSQTGVQLTFCDTASGEVEIDLNASHIDSLKRVKAPLERLIAGETLIDQGKPVWDNFFSTDSGGLLIKSVSRQTRTHIRPHNIRCFIKIWGDAADRETAKHMLLDELKRVRAKKSFAIPLSGNVLLQLLFSNLDDIRKEIGNDNASVNFSSRRLVIRGTEEQFHSVVRYLARQSDSVTVKGDSKRKADASGRLGICPVCLDGVTSAVTLGCGHHVCKECLVRYMISACDNKNFPLKCLGNDDQCTELLPLPLCQRLLQKEQFARLVDASFFTYIQTRPQEFHYCPTPDCPQIYRDAVGTILQCPTCLVSICSSCHGVQHEGVECRYSSEASERLFQEWCEQHNVKTCPSCSANIEKIAGCNHLMCTSCSTHICWECLETFPVSNDVYEHMKKVHGSIGLEV